MDELAFGYESVETALTLAKKIKTQPLQGSFNMRNKELMTVFERDLQFSSESPQQQSEYRSLVTEKDLGGHSKSALDSQQLDSHPRVLGQLCYPLLPYVYVKEWDQITKKLKKASRMSIRIGYCPELFGSQVRSTELHSFGEASESSYGACVYLRCEQIGRNSL